MNGLSLVICGGVCLLCECEMWCAKLIGPRGPSLDRTEGDDDDAFASFTFEFKAVLAHFRDELPAFAARLAGASRVGVGQCWIHALDEIENDY